MLSDALPHCMGITDGFQPGEHLLELLRPDGHGLLNLGCRGVPLQLRELLQQPWPCLHQCLQRVAGIEQLFQCQVGVAGRLDGAQIVVGFMELHVRELRS